MRKRRKGDGTIFFTRTGVCRSCERQYDLERTKPRYDAVYDYLSDNPCVDCGEDDIRILEFDHRDPGEKLDSVSNLLTSNKPMDLVFQEISKCDVRCVACHRKRTILQLNYYVQSYYEEKEAKLYISHYYDY